MSENVYTRVLAQLMAREGSADAVARLLHVPDKTMQRWMQGHAQMPLRAFLRALDLVVQHEERDAAPPTGEAAPASARNPERRTADSNRATRFA